MGSIEGGEGRREWRGEGGSRHYSFSFTAVERFNERRKHWDDVAAIWTNGAVFRNSNSYGIAEAFEYHNSDKMKVAGGIFG